MSRLARKPIAIPSGITVTTEDARVLVKGPKGDLLVPRLSGTTIVVENDGVMVTRTGTDRQSQANVGTMWSLVRNAIAGANEGFKKTLEIQGVGYRAVMEGTTLVLSLGFSHPVKFIPPDGVTLAVEKNMIHITGSSKEAVGQTAALIRKFREPEPYKGKGIRYQGEVVRMKAGKKAATSK
jgi:large subunit ribosomal protein L6